jgi:hypothetical protein
MLLLLLDNSKSSAGNYATVRIRSSAFFYKGWGASGKKDSFFLFCTFHQTAL